MKKEIIIVATLIALSLTFLWASRIPVEPEREVVSYHSIFGCIPGTLTLEEYESQKELFQDMVIIDYRRLC